MLDDHPDFICNLEEVLGDASAVSAGQVMMTSSHATGLLFENIVSKQKLDNDAAIANVSKGISNIFGNEIESQLRGEGISNAIAVAKMLASQQKK